MPTLPAQWTPLASTSKLQRSSHTLTTLNSTLYIFGGELKPREPRDNELHKISIPNNDTNAASVESIKAPTTNAPTPRVGAATTKIGNTMYMFSGRGGVAMAPIDEKGALWALDSETDRWSLISPSSGAVPEARSYHTMTSDNDDTLYLHAGCPEKGRLSDLWSFSLSKKEWKQLRSAPDPPRGGTSMAYVEGKVYRMNGFDGTREQGGSLDVYDIAGGEWETITYPADGEGGPGARSVAALVPVRVGGRGMCLVTLFGESDPSSLGHQGAGKMLRDVWVYELEKGVWSQVQASGGQPDARGWFDADVVTVGGKDGIAVGGGLGESNERLGDFWLLNF
ncbi:hypothetical protein M409DRAFT_15979 [Zasmidium cellare ATCC 36951]|uniref:Galactose oxidase n=1 Tax=Zasmidium cellare ATCC 36951 TaxID=1080233 RepID=A0A6A6D3S4_ZASCE|nr:uncharacterized protein M409DRAFT_15979 [Zasmidium cellare ATCC 36951]KAF2173705.1 hypothetical protein M409DRAFT_15979 [Zasmidium cellare ATCC 36951]